MSVRIGVDTGGTFTDVIAIDASDGSIQITKTPSTPPGFHRGVLSGIDDVIEQSRVSTSEVSLINHGTTVGTNAVLEGNLPEVGLITNEGLRDVLEIGDQTRPKLYDLQAEKRPAVVPRYLRTEVPGRIDAQGEEVDALDTNEAKRVVRRLADEGVDSIVVSMLFSYLNDDHEKTVGRIIETESPDMDYVLASSVHPEIREYERTITTVLNESIKRVVQRYFGRLVTGVEGRGINAPVKFMHAGGGVFGVEQATTNAIRTVLSGPAAGSVAARHVSDVEGYPDLIGMDMGGTSTDVSLVKDGGLVRSTEGEIDELPIKTPMIDINTVGAGGGSITWIDDGGVLRVGPESAGATPGPICYGRGGTEPTVTDANLLLGRIDPAMFLGGNMALDVSLSRHLLSERIAEPLGLSVEQAAMSVLRVANASLSREIRRVTIERGNDPRDFALLAFGGAGPLHAGTVATQMDMGTVIIPQNPGVFSARGLLIADVRITESRSYRDDAMDPGSLIEQFDTLEETLAARIERQGYGSADMTIDRAVDMRYAGQSYELTVPCRWERGTGTIDVDATIERFHAKHGRIYGHSMADEPVEIITLRATGRVETSGIEEVTQSDDDEPIRTTNEVYFADRGYVETAFYRRNALSPGAAIPGPAVLEEGGSTTVVPPKRTAEITPNRNVLIS